MGWTNYHRAKGETNAEHFGKEMNPGNTIVAHGTVGTTFYAAVHEGDTDEVIGMVILTQWSPQSDFNFSYKDMTENMGPVEDQAPLSVLKALTPTDSEYALAWRKRCWEYQEQRAAVRGLLEGDEVVLSRPVRFTNGESLDTFVVRRGEIAGGKRTKVVLTNEGHTYRLPHWQDRVVAVVRDGERRETPVGQRLAAMA